MAEFLEVERILRRLYYLRISSDLFWEREKIISGDLIALGRGSAVARLRSVELGIRLRGIYRLIALKRGEAARLKERAIELILACVR